MSFTLIALIFKYSSFKIDLAWLKYEKKVESKTITKITNSLSLSSKLEEKNFLISFVFYLDM